MKKALLISLLTVTLLSACASKPEKFSSFVESTVPVKVHVDPQLQQPCPPLPEVGKPATMESVAEHHLTTIGLYALCSSQQDTSLKIIRKLTNTESTQ